MAHEKTIPFLLLIILTLSVIAQDSTAAKADIKRVLLQKAKNKSIAGWTLLGGGAVFTITGSAIILDAIGGALDHNDYNSKMTRGSILALIGVAAMTTSIPLLIKAHKTHKEAMSLTMTNNRIAVPQYGLLSLRNYPVLKLSITLGNR